MTVWSNLQVATSFIMELVSSTLHSDVFVLDEGEELPEIQPLEEKTVVENAQIWIERSYVVNLVRVFYVLYCLLVIYCWCNLFVLLY